MRGFGFVQFTHGHESAKAIKGVSEINGRKVAIDWSLPREVYEQEKAKTEPEPEPEEESENEEIEEEPEMEEKSESENDQESDADSDSDASDEENSEDDEEIEPITDRLSAMAKPERKVPETGADVLEGRSVFLRNIPFDCTDDDLTELCGTYGTVKKVRIVKNDAGVSKGVAFVEFETKNEADLCVVNTKNLSVNGRPVFARISLPQTQIHTMQKTANEEKHAKKDRRNLALAREGEIREGSSAWKVSILSHVQLFLYPLN